MKSFRLLLFIEAALFFLAAGVHSGVLLQGWEHARAATAETVIACVLTLAAVGTWHRTHARTFALIGQSFALLGTIVGVIMVAIGVGPQTTPDLVYHMVTLAILIAGEVWLLRKDRWGVALS
jgi:hypothetical protein